MRLVGLACGSRRIGGATAAASILLLSSYSAHAFQPPSNATPQCHARGRHHSSLGMSGGGNGGEVRVGGSFYV